MSGRPELVVGEALLEALRPLVAELVEAELERRDRRGRVEWLTVDEYAARMRTSPDAVRKRLERGRIAGATKEGGRAWLIPVADKQPTGQGTLAAPTSRGERRANGPAPGTRR